MQLPITNYQFTIGDKKLQSGQSLFELVVAIGISALVIVVLVSLTSNALQNAVFSKNESSAGTYAQEATEWLRGQRDADDATFESHVSSSFNVARCFNNEPLDWTGIAPCNTGSKISGTPFVRQITFIEFTPVINGVTKDIVEADVTVSWTDSKGVHEVTNATDFSDWRQR
jgi:type II secretory pathway pseudopilin PulG